MASGWTTLWSPESGYVDLLHIGYPYPGFLDGGRTTFVVALASFNSDIEHHCKGIEQGFKLILTPPGNTLKTSQSYHRLKVSHSNLFNVIPKLTNTTHKLRHFNSTQRKCFYNDERQLHFFRIYSQENCQEKCLANFTMDMCRCAAFSMPSEWNFFYLN